jgi:hypothetical protein
MELEYVCFDCLHEWETSEQYPVCPECGQNEEIGILTTEIMMD